MQGLVFLRDLQIRPLMAVIGRAHLKSAELHDDVRVVEVNEYGTFGESVLHLIVLDQLHNHEYQQKWTKDQIQMRRL